MAKAKITQTTKDGIPNGHSVTCHFNPYEYTVSKTNNFSFKAENGSDNPKLNLDKVGPQALKLKLIFDGYEQGLDVGKEVHKMWDFMNPKKNPDFDPESKTDPPYVTFEWGKFKFIAVLTNMTQKFTLFKADGTPVRAEVNVTFTQHDDKEDYGAQNPTSGGGPIERVWQVTEADRIDLIAAEVYGDATMWPQIARYNNIVNPHKLRAGALISIPPANPTE